jgi:hypothetical protein
MQGQPHSHPEFSLVEGGPTHRLQHRLGLIGPGAPNLWRRVVLFFFLTWVPLLVISAVEGVAFGGGLKLPFLYDLAAYARCFVAIPLLVLAEGLVNRRVAESASHFVTSGLVHESMRPRYDAAIARCSAWRDSIAAELVALLIAAIGVATVAREFPFDFSTWRSTVADSVHHRTLAGWWYLVVTNGLFQFLVWRWVWRTLIWYRFLWLMSKLDLRLIPTHPDRSAGLGFVGDTQRNFWSIVVAVSATVAGVLANEIVYGGVALESYKFSIVAYAVVVVILFLAPLLMFSPMLVEAKEQGVRQYGALAISHNHMFHRKWVHGENPGGDPVLGTPEISSLADLGAAYDILAEMRAVPFDPEDAIVLLLAALVPMAPLLLTIMPFDKLLEMMSKLLA